MIVGTRGSALALRQTEYIVDLLTRRFPEIDFGISPLSTLGDRVGDRPISVVGDKGIFVRSIERALLDGAIDAAVHSLKDVPSDVETPGLVLGAFSVRQDPRDVLISRSGAGLEELPPRATVGTGSLRRRVQLLRLRPDLVPLDIRGNVDTRLRKLDEGQYDAIILAAAGLHRLGLSGRITAYLPPEQFVPDAGQGMLAVQVRAGDDAERLVAAIDDRSSRTAALAERAVVRALGADCHSPVGAYARIEGRRLQLLAMAALADGSRLARCQVEGDPKQAVEHGTYLGKQLLAAIEDDPPRDRPILSRD